MLLWDINLATVCENK